MSRPRETPLVAVPLAVTVGGAVLDSTPRRAKVVVASRMPRGKARGTFAEVRQRGNTDLRKHRSGGARRMRARLRSSVSQSSLPAARTQYPYRERRKRQVTATTSADSEGNGLERCCVRLRKAAPADGG